MADLEKVRFISSEQVSAKQFIAQWLIHEAQSPFMIGFLGNADPVDSFTVSQPLSRTIFCEANANFPINMDTVKDAHEKIKLLSWKKVVAPAIHQYHRFRIAESDTLEKERAKLDKLLSVTPELRGLLPKLGVLPNSGEYEVLSWLNIERTK